MAELAVDLTYGTALAGAAKDTEKEAVILEEGMQLVDIMKQEPDFIRFINYPGISAEEKKSVLSSVFEGKICTELLNFLYVLVDKRRTGRFENIMKVYKRILEEEEGVLYGTVYSVIGMDDEQIAEIEKETSNLLQTKVKLTNEMDPGIMAGVKVLIDGRIIDASYKKKLDEMSANIRKS